MGDVRPPGVPPPPPGPPPLGPVPGDPLPGDQPLVPVVPPVDPDVRWRRALYIGLGLAAVGVVAVIIAVLATRGGGSGNGGVAVTSPSASASPSGSPTPTATATPTAAPTPTPTAAPAPAPAATANPVQNTPAEQAALLLPSNGTECSGSGCPVTQDLVRAAATWRAHHSSNPLCRCSVSYGNSFAQEDDNLELAGDQGNPARAAVNVSLTFPSGHHEDIVVLFSRQADGSWLATDTYCGDKQNRLGAAAATDCIS